MRFIPLLFIALPILEMWFLIKVGSAIGAWTTICLVIFGAVAGMSVLRHQGLRTLVNVQQRMQSGESPALEILEGFLLALAGVLLLVPGLLSDVLGIFLLVPWARRLIVKLWLKNIHVYKGNMSSASNAAGSTTIEGEFSREDRSMLP